MAWLETAGGGGSFAIAVLIVAALLGVLARRDRKSVIVTAGIFIAAVLLRWLGAQLTVEWASTLLRSLGGFIAGAAVLKLSGIAVFRVVLPASGLALPRILEDVSMAASYLVWAFVLLRVLGW